MRFDKHHIWPAVETHSTPMEQRYSSKWGTGNVALLHDEVVAYNHLSRIAVVLASFSLDSVYARLVLVSKTGVQLY